MPIDPELVERIYEAGAVPERWPDLLDTIADRAGAFGATIVTLGPQGASIMATPRTEQIVQDYIAEGWAEDREYAAFLWEEQHPGFCAETRWRTVEEIERLPVHVQFFAPRGLVAGVGTIVPGVQNDAIQVALEGFPSHSAAERAVEWLDQLRPAWARALGLSASLRARADANAVAALASAGVAAAVIARDGRLRAGNAAFETRLGAAMHTRGNRVRFADRALQARLDLALEALDAPGGVRSVAVPAREAGERAFAIHLLPLRRDARDIFNSDGVLLLIAEAANASLPGTDLLRMLFDLTPAEARLARLLVEGEALAAAAHRIGITEGTARTHLRRVFAKTGVARQAELMRLLLGLGAPG